MKKKNKQRKIGFLNILLSVQKDLIVGGQAVMEGVMMRTPSAYAIAVRKKDGSIVHTAETLPKWSDTYKWLNLPILRGGATLIQSMALGVKALNFSANIAQEDMEAQEVAEKANDLQMEPALVDGTTNENFSKARVKVICQIRLCCEFKTMCPINSCQTMNAITIWFLISQFLDVGKSVNQRSRVI